MLMTSSNFVGCSTGRSAGLAPAERRAAPAAELLAALVQETARWARGRERQPALTAEAAPLTVLRVAPRTLHSFASDRSGRSEGTWLRERSPTGQEGQGDRKSNQDA